MIPLVTFHKGLNPRAVRLSTQFLKMVASKRHKGWIFLTSEKFTVWLETHIVTLVEGVLQNMGPSVEIREIKSKLCWVVRFVHRWVLLRSKSTGLLLSFSPLMNISTLTDSLGSPSYRISSGDPQGWFSVHPKSGLISNVKPLDHESQPYVLLVLQSYTDASLVYSTTQVNITVADINDNTPAFPKSRDVVTVSRNTRPGTVLFIAHAHDSDSGANGRVLYHLRSTRNGLFGIDRRLGTLTLNQSLLADHQQRHILEVVARDEGEPPQSSTLTLALNVDSSLAEDSLAFETLAYQVEIGEAFRKDSRVIQVRAHRSRGAHTSFSGISYSLEAEAGSPPVPFRVHPKTGWLYLSNHLDYEAETRFRFRVFATASGEAATANTTASATVTVLVMDINDNAPVFSRDVYYFTVSEGSSPQDLVGTVRATDRDSGKNGQMSYILLSDGKFFRINAKTGEY